MEQIRISNITGASMSELSLIAVAVLHGMAGIGFAVHSDYPMAMVMAGFTIADIAFIWYALL